MEKFFGFLCSITDAKIIFLDQPTLGYKNNFITIKETKTCIHYKKIIYYSSFGPMSKTTIVNLDILLKDQSNSTKIQIKYIKEKA